MPPVPRCIPKADDAATPQSFYTVTGEIALARHQPRTAALQYAAAAAHDTDVKLLERATQVAAQTLQPTITQKMAARWSQVDPKSVEAQRAAARADLALYKIEQSASHYRNVLAGSPLGADAEFRALEAELGSNDNIFGARQLADRLASSYPASPAALRVQGFTALRADDPAAAVHSFTAALALPGPSDQDSEHGARHELLQTLARAQIMAGDTETPLAQAQADAGARRHACQSPRLCPVADDRAA